MATLTRRRDKAASGDTTSEPKASKPAKPSKSARHVGSRPGFARRFRRHDANLDEPGLELTNPAGEVVHSASPPIAASLRSMLSRLRVGDGVPTRLGVTSAIRGEGVTSISRTVAMLLASEAGKRVCVVDLNWWMPPAWPAADDHDGGLSEVLAGRLRLDRALVTTGNARLFYLPAGAASSSERAVLASSDALETVLAALEREFDHVIVDLPAVHTTSEALALAEHARELLIVVRQGVTSESQVQTALEELTGVKVLGVVLNATAINVPRMVLRRIPSV